MKKEFDVSIGDRYGTWLVLSNAMKTIKGRSSYCMCSCGAISVKLNIVLINKKNKYCKECQSKHKTTHGQSKTKSYKAWNQMRMRCTNPKVLMWERYGGRGIKVCDRWNHSFENFYADMGESPKDKSLDRIDVNGDYSPENCRWSDDREQMNNMSTNIFVYFEGNKYTVSILSRKLGVKYKSLLRRVKKGVEINKDTIDEIKRKEFKYKDHINQKDQ